MSTTDVAPSIKGYTLAGTTKHFRIYYDNAFPSVAKGRAKALAWLKVIEQDYNRVTNWFEGVSWQTVHGNVLLTYRPGYIYAGAWWGGSLPNFQTYVGAGDDTPLNVIRSQYVCELSEQLMLRQHKGWFAAQNNPTGWGNEGTHGEALSQVCGLELARAIGDKWVLSNDGFYDWAGIWLDTGRPDGVNYEDYTYSGTDFNLIGCEVLFMYWLMFEHGFTLKQIVQHAGATMRQVYINLTNDPTDPFPIFKAQLDKKFPPTQKWERVPRGGLETQNPYPIDASPAQQYRGDSNPAIEWDIHYPGPVQPPPAPEYSGGDFVAVPAARIRGYVDGVTVSGATASFSSATELTQFATGDMAIPPVTSGSPVAALDLAWQLAGNNRFTEFVTSDVGGTYWSLQGHEAGFDVLKQKVVTGRDETAYRLFHEKIVGGIPQGAVYRCSKIKDSYTSSGWTAYSDGIYSTSGQGSSPTVRPGRRTHIMATTRPGQGPITFTFGTGFSDLGYGPNGEVEGYGKYFNVTLDSALLTITGGYRKIGGVPVTGVLAQVSTLALNINSDSIIQMVIGLEWTDATTFTIHAYAATADMTWVELSVPFTNTGRDLYATPWKHVGAIRALFVQQDVSSFDPEQAMPNLIGPYESGVPMRNTLQSWGLEPNALIIGMTGNLWDYLTQVAVARQVDFRTDDGAIVISPMSDVAYTSHLWDPVAHPSISVGVDNTSKYVEVVWNRAAWSPNGVTFYDAKTTGDSFSMAPGTTQTFSASTSAAATLYYTPAPVGYDSSITQDEIDAANALLDGAAKDAAWQAIYDKAQADALRDFTDFRNESGHPWGAYVITGTFAGISNHTMPAREWIAYGGQVSVEAADDTNLKVTVVAPAIPGWTGDYTIGFSDGTNTYPALRLVGNGITYRAQTVRFATGANPKTTSTEVGATINNVAATTRRVVNNLGLLAARDASGPSMELSAAISMAEIHEWGQPVGLIPGSSVLYQNMQWRITSTTISNSSVTITATPYTTYQSGYWDYNWTGLNWDEFNFYWSGLNWDDYKVEPLNGAIAEWSNTGGKVKYTLFPLPDPNDPSVPLEPADDLLPGRLVVPYAPLTTTVTAIYPSDTLYPGGQVG